MLSMSVVPIPASNSPLLFRQLHSLSIIYKTNLLNLLSLWLNNNDQIQIKLLQYQNLKSLNTLITRQGKEFLWSTAINFCNSEKKKKEL
jgi:hypothetical protein